MAGQSDAPGRRAVVKIGLAAIPIGAVPGPLLQRAVYAQAVQAGHPAYTPQFFSAAEWRFVNAFCDRIIPADEHGPGAVAAGVPEFIDRQLEAPWGHGRLWYRHGPFIEAPDELGLQLDLVPRQVYRNGIAAMDDALRRAIQKTFVELSDSQRDLAIAALEKGEIDLGAVPASYFFSLLVQNTQQGFFSDPVHGGNKGMVGWKLIGFPGARADFWDWADRYDGKAYPLPPVSIDSQRS